MLFIAITNWLPIQFGFSLRVLCVSAVSVPANRFTAETQIAKVAQSYSFRERSFSLEIELQPKLNDSGITSR